MALCLEKQELFSCDILKYFSTQYGCLECQ